MQAQHRRTQLNPRQEIRHPEPVESYPLGTGKMESPKAIPKGEGSRERTESTISSPTLRQPLLHQPHHLPPQQFYPPQRFCMRQCPGTHLHVQPGNTAEHLVEVQNLFRHCFRVTITSAPVGPSNASNCGRRVGGQPRSLPIAVNIRA
jgi:hypothetical protein